MASTGTKWMIGCGIGCGLLVLIGAAIVGGGALFVGNLVERAQEIEVASDAVVSRFGRPEDFCPDADGGIRPQRLEAFLDARNRLAPLRQEMEESLGLLARGETSLTSPTRLFRTIRSGAGLIPRIMSYIKARNKALLAAEIGPGEYDYIYSLAYYAWLGKSPADGPPFILTGGDDENDTRDEWEVRDMRRQRMIPALRGKLLPMLRCQLSTLDPEPQAAWAARLAAEVAALEADRYRLPWEDGLPPRLEASMAPYRERLEEQYCELCNPLEIEGL